MTEGSEPKHIRPRKRETAPAANRKVGAVEAGIEQKKPSGILRKPKYSSSKTEETDAESSILPSAPVAVQDFVVERPRRTKKEISPPLPVKPSTAAAAAASAAGSIEGYEPKITTARASKQTVQKIKTKPTQSHNEEKACDEILIFDSLAALMEQAGTLPPNNNMDEEEPPQVIEADLSFSCMAPDVYQQMRSEEFEFEQRVFMGPQRDENSDPGDDDDDGLWDFLTGKDDDEETEPAPPPRAFLQLWKAISQWISPQAVQFVRKLRTEESSTIPIFRTPNNDIEASRCTGLMSLLSMFTNTAMKELKIEDHRHAEKQLGDLLRCFNYSQPSPKLDTAHTRALTCVLLRTVVPTKDDDDESTVESCKALGLCDEEYRYLCQSAILNFGVPSE